MASSAKEQRIARLKSAAEKRKKQALDRVEKAIRKLMLGNELLSIAAVARAADVSAAYLYKYPELKRRIQKLRLQQEESGTRKVKPAPLPSSDKSKDVIITHLKRRIKELESDRDEQKKHLASLSGQLYELLDQKELASRLRKENKTLAEKIEKLKDKGKDQLEEDGVISSVAVSSSIASAMSELEIKLTPSICEKIIAHPQSRVMNALSVVQEAEAAGKVRSKSGLFVKALDEGWEPAQDSFSIEKQRDNAEFSKWFDVARKKGQVYASKLTDEGFLILTKEKKWVPYDVLRAKL